MESGHESIDWMHEEYLRIEEAAEQRHEYLAGAVLAMPDSSESHSLIGLGLLAELTGHLRGRPCRLYGPNMRLYIPKHDKFCYPDGQVLCEQSIRHQLYVENPCVIVEIFSDATEAYDRGLKFEHYRSIETLEYYLLVDESRKYVDVYERQTTNSWLLTSPYGQIALPKLDIALDMEEIYRQMEFPKAPDMTQP